MCGRADLRILERVLVKIMDLDYDYGLFSGLYKPCTGDTGILAALALIYSTHRLLVVWIIVAHFQVAVYGIVIPY